MHNDSSNTCTCKYNQDPDKKSGEEKRDQHSAQRDLAAFASFVASIHHRRCHGGQEDEAHILHLPHRKWQSAFDAEYDLVDPTTEEDQLHHLAQDWLEKVVLWIRQSVGQQSVHDIRP